MQFVDLSSVSYIGADIIPEIINQNQEKYGQLNRRFMSLDITQDDLISADLLFCRDCLVHFSFADIQRTIINIKRNRVNYLLTTTFPNCELNEDIITGDWRLLNFTLPPFNFPPPLYLINEQCSEGNGEFQDKSLGLWLVESIP
ncbi:class I SAM-dependent methyltransferase [Pseudanabaena yagii]|uniref:Class I SAM-dependent methyltransferase n=1 Tax=Pseudanabaena yagii GIHE-NHR1 TaxID=2722753 RepID=A0ABX1LXW7_9CYAN|nr:class I SAM-dependent methyltransferase [Pseudanabaena yagii]NMF61042.1 class I SAM-dependent methyltransferase [Pseudanabaena yagii GIHE-NHR1]